MYVKEGSVPTKLTLRLDEELIQKAKAYSAKTGRSVSRLVADYFAALDRAPSTEDLPPIVASLKGVLRDGTADEQEYRRHLEERYL
jgi:hypothetical protein